MTIMNIMKSLVTLVTSLVKSAFLIYDSIPRDLFDLIQKIIESSIKLSQIEWINTILLFLAGSLPVIIMYFASKLFCFPKELKTLLTIVLYLLLIFLFTRVWFKIFIILLFVIIVFSLIIFERRQLE